ncbi:MAG: hypothetical protein O6846_01800 [Thaumarchaeota archaeon]|nr:hypothetical protein [Nitrososphaerota archaeon]
MLSDIVGVSLILNTVAPMEAASNGPIAATTDFSDKKSVLSPTSPRTGVNLELVQEAIEAMSTSGKLTT